MSSDIIFKLSHEASYNSTQFVIKTKYIIEFRIALFASLPGYLEYCVGTSEEKKILNVLLVNNIFSRPVDEKIT